MSHNANAAGDNYPSSECLVSICYIERSASLTVYKPDCSSRIPQHQHPTTTANSEIHSSLQQCSHSLVCSSPLLSPSPRPLGARPRLRSPTRLSRRLPASASATSAAAPSAARRLRRSVFARDALSTFVRADETSYSFVQAGSAAGSAALSEIGVVVNDLATVIGIGCSPITVEGSCSASPVCCEDNSVVSPVCSVTISHILTANSAGRPHLHRLRSDLPVDKPLPSGMWLDSLDRCSCIGRPHRDAVRSA